MLYVKSALGFFQMPNFRWAVSNLSDGHAFVEALFIQPIFCPVQEDCAVFYNVLSLAKISSASSFHHKWSCFLLLVCVFKMQPLKYLGQNCTCSHCHLPCVPCFSWGKKASWWKVPNGWDSESLWALFLLKAHLPHWEQEGQNDCLDWWDRKGDPVLALTFCKMASSTWFSIKLLSRSMFSFFSQVDVYLKHFARMYTKEDSCKMRLL